MQNNGRPRALWSGLRPNGLSALILAPLALLGCSSSEPVDSAVGVTAQAVEAANCGYSLSVDVKKVNKKGFSATVKIMNSDGHLATSGFTVLVNAGAAQLTHVGHGTFTAVEGGYLLSTVASDETEDDLDGDDADPDVLNGRAYRFHLKFTGTYTTLKANIISSGGVNCDQTAPTVKLATSSDFFTANGTLVLTAEATDNSAVSKVVFARDGVVIGTVNAAPYALSIPVSKATNGRHRYSATAYDLTGNQASVTKRVLVAIDNKFFGTAATTAADYPSLVSHFDQITPGNAGKWGSVEASRDQMNFTDLDTAYTFAKNNHLRFKLHTLVWGQQQPSWITALPAAEQLAELDQWMTALAERYPDADMVDVVNEPLHAPPSYAAALGGAGTTGYDWVVKAFEMAREHFPNAELILNDYSILSMTSATSDYLKIVKILSDRGLIDGVGEQGHFYERAPELSVLTANLNSLAATGLPLYITELDLNFADDARQANRMKDLFTAFWSNPSVLGVTHWGYLQGNMWQPNAYLVRTDGTLRPALSWIECYRAGGTNCTVPVYVPQPRTGDLNAISLEAEEYDNAQGLLPAGNVVAYAGDGAWFEFDKVVFNDNWNTLNVAYAQGGSNTINLSVHLDSLANPPVATVQLPPTGGWGTIKTVSLPWAPLTGQKNVFIRFNGGGANVDKVQFAAPAETSTNLVADSDFEAGTVAGFWSWSTGTIANTTARAVTGTHALAMKARTGNSPLVKTVTSSVIAGRNYKVSLWATIGGAPSDSAYVTTVTQCSGADPVYGRLGGWGNTKTIADGSWVEFAGDLSVPNCALTNVGFWLEGPGAGVDLYIDHVSARAQASANLVPDGTFESGVGAWNGWGYASLTAVNTAAHSGAQCLKGTTMSANSAIARDIKAFVTGGKKYQATAWVSVGGQASGSGSVKLQTVQNCDNKGDSYPWLMGATVANGAWSQLSGTVDLSACTSVDKLLLFVGADSGDLYIDDVTLTPLP